MVGQGLFAKTYGGSSADRGYSVIQTADGGYAVAGETYSFGAGGGWNDFFVLKLNPDGSVAWAKTYGGTSIEFATSIIQTTDGGYAVAGMTYTFSAGQYDPFVLKLNPDGSVAWTRVFGGIQNDEIWSITQTTDGCYVVAGNTNSFPPTEINFFVAKLNSNGSIAWVKTYDAGATDYAYSVVATTDGGCFVGGRRTGTANDFFVLKLNSDGSVAWGRIIGGPKSEEAYCMTRTTDGGCVLAGYTISFAVADTYDIFVVKLNSDGSLAWAKVFGGPKWDGAECITQTSDGGYAVGGFTYSFGAGNTDYLVLKLNPDGSLAWARTFGGTGYEEPRSIVQTMDGGYVLTGPSGWDVLVLKLDQNGNYPGCVQDCSPVVGTPSPSISSISTGANCSPNTSSPNPIVTSPTPVITNICAPVYEYVEERGLESGPPITCLSVPGGLVFRSEADTDLRLYAPDGRLSYSGKLQKGENRISLDQGVYLWTTRNHKGKAVVR
ncbi:MAG: hypothetical protein ABIM74_02010 [candidate division WOR-3 bacterium]